jgi:hypothetical protein
MKFTTIVFTAVFAITSNAAAKDGLVVQSEEQFARDFASQAESVAPGVYRLNAGELAGKTVSIGYVGLAYDLELHRARLKKTNGNTSGASHEIVRTLERVQAEQVASGKIGEMQIRTTKTDVLSCRARDASTDTMVTFSGRAFVNASAELYMPRGGGGLNYYYARAFSDAVGTVFKPANVIDSIFMFAGAIAENRLTGTVLSMQDSGTTDVSVAAGPVYSGPTAGHNLLAFAFVSGRGVCSGYVSVSDTDWHP